MFEGRSKNKQNHQKKTDHKSWSSKFSKTNPRLKGTSNEPQKNLGRERGAKKGHSKKNGGKKRMMITCPMGKPNRGCESSRGEAIRLPNY